VKITQDGHFQLTRDHDADPVPGVVADSKQARVIQPLQSQEEGGGWHFDLWKATRQPSASSFVNRTSNWVALSHVANGSLSSDRLTSNKNDNLVEEEVDVQETTTPPGIPARQYKTKPKSWSSTAWRAYEKAYQTLMAVRSGPGHIGMTVASAFAPDSCILKIVYVFFRMEDEDDYPYIPRGCGDMFDFAMNANSIPVPWMLIVGALYIITGTHSSANSASQ
jgi:hypothetical protein